MALGTAISGAAGQTKNWMNRATQQAADYQSTAGAMAPTAWGGGTNNAAGAARSAQPPPRPTYQPRPGAAPGSYRPSPASGDGGAGQRQNANAALSYAMTQYGPQSNGLMMDRHQLAQNAGFQQAGLGLSMSELQGNHASNMAQLGLAQQGLGLDRNDLATQQGYIDLDRRGLGLDSRGNVIDRGYINTVQGIADQVLASQLAGYDRDYATDTRNTTSDFTARGAFFAPFHKAELADTYASTLQRKHEANLGRQQDEAGWQKDLGHLGLSDERIGLDHERLDLRGRDLATAEQRLDLESQRLGLQRADYDRALSEGLARLGLEGQINASELAFMLSGNDQAQAQLAMQIMTDALMYSGNPAVMQILGGAYANQGR